MTVTFETAKRLKDAGFSQPFFEKGQIWYDSMRTDWIVSKKADFGINESRLVVNSLQNINHYEYIEDTNGFIFAPTATDIMKELGLVWCLMGETGSGLFRVFNYNSKFIDENPAEAAAIAWLQSKENTQL